MMLLLWSAAMMVPRRRSVVCCCAGCLDPEKEADDARRRIRILENICTRPFLLSGFLIHSSCL